MDVREYYGSSPSYGPISGWTDQAHVPGTYRDGPFAPYISQMSGVSTLLFALISIIVYAIMVWYIIRFLRFLPRMISIYYDVFVSTALSAALVSIFTFDIYRLFSYIALIPLSIMHSLWTYLSDAVEGIEYPLCPEDGFGSILSCLADRAVGAVGHTLYVVESAFVGPSTVMILGINDYMGTVLAFILVSASLLFVVRAVRTPYFARMIVSKSAIPPRAKDMALICFLVVSGYFSAISLIAIPVVSEDVSKGAYSASDLSSEVTKIAEAFRNETIDPSDVIDIKSAAIDMTGLSEEAQAVADDWNALSAQYIKDMSDTYVHTKEIYARTVSDYVNTLAKKYEVISGNGVQTRENIQFYYGIYNGIIARVSFTRNVIAGCREYIDNQSGYAMSIRNAISGYLSPSSSSDVARDELSRARSRLAARQDSISLYCPAPGVIIADIDAPRAGDALGVLGIFTGWLLSTQSMPIVLITGMLGFGFLGASISTFVKEGSVGSRASGAPIVDDLAGVILRGVSAAVVVFLGFYGGVSIISETGAPQPWAMLFLCFVGAVFSEPVWIWARNRLMTALDDEPSDGSRRAVREGPAPRRRKEQAEGTARQPTGAGGAQPNAGAVGSRRGAAASQTDNPDRAPPTPRGASRRKAASGTA